MKACVPEDGAEIVIAVFRQRRRWAPLFFRGLVEMEGVVGGRARCLEDVKKAGELWEREAWSGMP